VDIALSPKKNNDNHNYVESITSYNKGHSPENEWRDMKFFITLAMCVFLILCSYFLIFLMLRVEADLR
jgi:hypothetical protein